MSLDKIASKRVLIRFDYNVPMNQGRIVNDFRIKQSLATIKLLLKNKNKLILMSHLGRPKEGKYDKNNSTMKMNQQNSTFKSNHQYQTNGKSKIKCNFQLKQVSLTKSNNKNTDSNF